MQIDFPAHRARACLPTMVGTDRPTAQTGVMMMIDDDSPKIHDISFFFTLFQSVCLPRVYVCLSRRLFACPPK